MAGQRPANADELLERVRRTGVLPATGAVVAMLSGGRDSVCLLDVLVRLCGSHAVHPLHVNYGLRDAAADEQRRCATLCERLGVPLQTVRAARPPEPGNLQAWARDVRYDAALALATPLDGLIATGHTASDQAETILYRLAASPGRRALLGMAARERRVIRPLLVLGREETAAYCRERRLPWSEDESNLSERYARNRVRLQLLPQLRAVHPAAESNLVRTAQLLREETELLDGLVDAELAGGANVALSRLEAMPAALARLVVVRLAEQARGALVPQAGDRVAEILALGRRGGLAELHVGGGVGAVVRDGLLSMVRLPPRAGAGAARGARAATERD